MLFILLATLTALLSTAQAFTGHAARACRQIKPRSSFVESRSYMRDNNAGSCFTQLDICMDYYHPSPAEMYITLTNKAHNAFVCLSDDNGWESCVQASGGVPCNAGVPINSVRIYANLYTSI